jgi:hypothetical protein
MMTDTNEASWIDANIKVVKHYLINERIRELYDCTSSRQLANAYVYRQ